MRQLTLIRHALTEWNSTKRFQGQTDIALSREGLAQTKALAKRLNRPGSSVDLIYSSPLKRAVDTARAAFPGREILLDNRLMELNFGEFEGRTHEANAQHPAWAWWQADPFERLAPGGESYRQLRERVVDWLNELPQEGHIVAFSHSGTIQMLLAHLLGVERPRWRKRIFIRHTSLTRVLFSENDCIIERVNDTRHLSREVDDPFYD